MSDAHQVAIQITNSAVFLGFVILALLAFALYFREIFCLDIARKYQYGTKDGYTPFGALLGFGLAQGAALTAVAREDRYKFLVLFIYLAAVVVTLGWIIATLRALSEVVTGNQIIKTRAYDGATIKFGHGTLIWTLFQAVIMIVLAYNQLLPNQTPRDPYVPPRNLIETRSYWVSELDRYFPGGLGEVGATERPSPLWMQWLAFGERVKPKTERYWKLVCLAQLAPFPAAYRTFHVQIWKKTEDDEVKLKLADEDKLQLGDAIAFLVKWNRDEPGPSFRQLAFIPESGTTQSDTFIVTDPDPGEFLMVLARLTYKQVSKEIIYDDPNKLRIGISLAR
jgi:hypothetical protein